MSDGQVQASYRTWVERGTQGSTPVSSRCMRKHQDEGEEQIPRICDCTTSITVVKSLPSRRPIQQFWSKADKAQDLIA